MKAVFRLGVAAYCLIGLLPASALAASGSGDDTGSGGGAEPVYEVQALVEAISPAACSGATNVVVQGYCLAFNMPTGGHGGETPSVALPADGETTSSK